MQFIPPVPYRSRQRMLYAGSTAFRRNLEGHDQSRRQGNPTHHANSAFTFTAASRVPSGGTRAKVGRVSMPTTRHRELLQQSVSTTLDKESRATFKDPCIFLDPSQKPTVSIIDCKVLRHPKKKKEKNLKMNSPCFKTNKKFQCVW